MTLRITVAQYAAHRCVRLEGRLTGEEVSELDAVVGDAPGAVCLELEDLQSADHDGLVALRRLRREGVDLRVVPPHLAWRLEDEE